MHQCNLLVLLPIAWEKNVDSSNPLGQWGKIWLFPLFFILPWIQKTNQHFIPTVCMFLVTESIRKTWSQRMLRFTELGLIAVADGLGYYNDRSLSSEHSLIEEELEIINWDILGLCEVWKKKENRRLTLSKCIYYSAEAQKLKNIYIYKQCRTSLSKKVQE